MTEQVAAEIWREIKRYINPTERSDAVETILSVMIDHDCDPDDIRAAFAGDPVMIRALKDYLDDASDESDEAYEEDDYEEDQDY